MIYRGMSDYMVIQVIVLALLLLYPQIALWLPSVVRCGAGSLFSVTAPSPCGRGHRRVNKSVG